jgi:hypothetical protein
MQRSQRSVGELVVELEKDALGTLQEQPPQPVLAQPGIVVERMMRRGVELRGDLCAGVARADDDEGCPAPSFGRVHDGVGDLELLDDVIAQGDGFAERLDASGCLRETRHVRETGHRPGSEHQTIPLQHAVRARSGHDGHGTGIQID